MIATTSFTCNICGEESMRICARCTKDTCNNHLCEKCARCSDCCECEVARDESVRPVVRPHPEESAAPPVTEEGAPVPPFDLAEVVVDTDSMEPAVEETAPPVSIDATPAPIDPIAENQQPAPAVEPEVEPEPPSGTSEPQ